MAVEIYASVRSANRAINALNLFDALIVAMGNGFALRRNGQFLRCNGQWV